jgi:hypothetical protein
MGGRSLDAKSKQPFAIAMKDGQPYALAGLWKKWKDHKTGAELLTFTVITTDPNEVVQPMHDRMPVIIPEWDYDRWLRPGDPDCPPIDLLRPYDADKMTAWKVGKAVGNVKNDWPELTGPASAAPEQFAEPLPERLGRSSLKISISAFARRACIARRTALLRPSTVRESKRSPNFTTL